MNVQGRECLGTQQPRRVGIQLFDRFPNPVIDAVEITSESRSISPEKPLAAKISLIDPRVTHEQTNRGG